MSFVRVVCNQMWKNIRSNSSFIVADVKDIDSQIKTCLSTNDRVLFWIRHFGTEPKLHTKSEEDLQGFISSPIFATISAGKVMTTIFWESGGVLLIRYLSHQCRITGERYVELIYKVRERDAVDKNGRGKYWWKFLCCSIRLIKTAFYLKILQGHLYFIDLALSAYFLSKIKSTPLWY